MNAFTSLCCLYARFYLEVVSGVVILMHAWVGLVCRFGAKCTASIYDIIILKYLAY